MPGCSTSANIGLAGEQRGSSSTSWVKVWYGPHDTPWRSSTSRSSASVWPSTQGLSVAPITSRAAKRPPSSARSTSMSLPIVSNASASPVASTSPFHCRSVSATIITRRSSLVRKSRPKAP